MDVVLNLFEGGEAEAAAQGQQPDAERATAVTPAATTAPSAFEHLVILEPQPHLPDSPAMVDATHTIRESIQSGLSEVVSPQGWKATSSGGSPAPVSTAGTAEAGSDAGASGGGALPPLPAAWPYDSTSLPQSAAAAPAALDGAGSSSASGSGSFTTAGGGGGTPGWQTGLVTVLVSAVVILVVITVFALVHQHLRRRRQRAMQAVLAMRRDELAAAQAADLEAAARWLLSRHTGAGSSSGGLSTPTAGSREMGQGGVQREGGRQQHTPPVLVIQPDLGVDLCTKVESTAVKEDSRRPAGSGIHGAGSAPAVPGEPAGSGGGSGSSGGSGDGSGGPLGSGGQRDPTGEQVSMAQPGVPGAAPSHEEATRPLTASTAGVEGAAVDVAGFGVTGAAAAAPESGLELEPGSHPPPHNPRPPVTVQRVAVEFPGLGASIVLLLPQQGWLAVRRAGGGSWPPHTPPPLNTVEVLPDAEAERGGP